MEDSQERQGQRQHPLGMESFPEYPVYKGMNLLLVDGR